MQFLDDGMRWRIAGILEAGQSQVQIPRDFNVMPSVLFYLWKQFKNAAVIEKKLEQYVQDPQWLMKIAICPL